MVTKSTVALVAIAFIAVFVAVSWYLGSLPQITQKLSEGVSAAKTLFNPLINAWNGLPDIAQKIVLGVVAGIPTLFFMWTKNRAMTKLQQTEQQAATQTTQLKGELTEAQSALQETTELKAKLAVYEKEGAVSAAQHQFDEMRDKYLETQAELKRTKDQLSQAITENNLMEKEREELKGLIERIKNPGAP